MSLDPFQNIRRVNRQQRFVVRVNGHEAPDLQQQVTQVIPWWWNRCLQHRMDLVGSGVASRIDVHLHRTFEQASRGFKHSSWQFREIPLVRHQLSNRRQPNREPDEAVGVAGQVLGQLVVGLEPRDENVETKGPEDFRPGEKILVIKALARAQAPQRHLGQHDGLLSCDAWLLQKLIERPREEVEREFGRGPEAASLDEDWFLVKDLRRLHDLAVRYIGSWYGDMVDLAAISFLGLGVQPPAPNWGVMISENQPGILQGYPLPALAAGLCIVGVVIAFNVLGERLFEQAQAARR